MRAVIGYCYIRKSNSSFGAMPMHTTFYEGEPAPIPEAKHSWNIW